MPKRDTFNRIGVNFYERQQSSREKKKALLEKFRSVTHTSVTSSESTLVALDSIDAPLDENDIGDAIKSLKQRISNLETQVKRAKRKFEAAFKVVNDQKREIAALKHERFSLQQALEVERDSGKRLQSEVKELKTILHEKEEALSPCLNR
jgi:chromosome segregation ATPase